MTRLSLRFWRIRRGVREGCRGVPWERQLLRLEGVTRRCRGSVSAAPSQQQATRALTPAPQAALVQDARARTSRSILRGILDREGAAAADEARQRKTLC